jgi:tetratricopeptide (TPR) repeat protein
MNPTILILVASLMMQLTPDQQEKVKLLSAKWSVAGMKAETLVTKKKYAEAEAIYIDILNQRKDLNLDLLPEYERLGPLYEAWGKKDKAEEMYKAMLAGREKLNENFDDQTTQFPLEQLATFLEKNGRAAEAKPLRARIAKIEKETATMPHFAPITAKLGSPQRLTDSRAMRLLGERLVKSDQQSKAIFYFKRAFELDPKSAEAACDLADMYWWNNQSAKALAGYDVALKLNPKLAKAWIGRAYVHEGLKRYADAVADFDKAIALDPKDTETMGARAKLLDTTGKHKEAVEGFTRIISVNPALYWPYIQRAVAYTELKDYSKALADYGTLLKRAPEDPDFYEFRSQVYKAMGDKKSEAADLATSKKLNHPQ